MVWESESSNSKIAQLQKYITIAEDRLSAGADYVDVKEQLVEMGLPPGEAGGIVEKVSRRLENKLAETNVSAAERARLARSASHVKKAPVPKVHMSKLLILGAAFFAALIAGYVWSVIALFTGYEFGYIALAVGWFVGVVVVVVADGRDNFIVPLMAASAALFGVLFGKYLIFLNFFNEYSAEMLQELRSEGDVDPQLAMEFAPLGLFDGVSIFLPALSEFGGYDFLWIFLAVVSAWAMAAYDSQ